MENPTEDSSARLVRDIVIVGPSEIKKKPVAGEVLDEPKIDRKRVEELLAKIEGQRSQGYINLSLLNALLMAVGSPEIDEIAQKMVEAKQEDDSVIGRVIVDPGLYRASGDDLSLSLREKDQLDEILQ